MFRRDIFALIAVTLIGVVLTLWIVIEQTPFFPQSLLTTYGDCAPRPPYPAHRRVVLHDYEADWFADSLIGFHEQPLFQAKDAPRRTVRFVYLRSFDAPVMVRVMEGADGRFRLVGKMMQGLDGCGEAGGCVVDRVLTREEQARLTAAQIPLLRQPSFGCDGGVDGSTWIIEASGGGDYQLWSAWTPEGGEVRELGVTMLDLTGWRFREVY